MWKFPLNFHDCSGIPVFGHPGSFLYKRKHHIHTGVDLYTTDGALVYSVEDGIVVGKDHFTGDQDNSPWWENTECILIEGLSGVVCYGEIYTSIYPKIGDVVKRGDCIAKVKRVLKGNKKKDVIGHSTSMLHIELYPNGKYKPFEETGPNAESIDILIDPTPYLYYSEGRSGLIFK